MHSGCSKKVGTAAGDGGDAGVLGLEGDGGVCRFGNGGGGFSMTMHSLSSSPSSIVSMARFLEREGDAMDPSVSVEGDCWRPDAVCGGGVAGDGEGFPCVWEEASLCMDSVSCLSPLAEETVSVRMSWAVSDLMSDSMLSRTGAAW